MVRVVKPSATLAADERVRRKLAAGEDILHLAFGEAGLPVLPGVADALARGARDNRYGSVAGSARAREAAAGYFARRGLPTDPEQIVFAPGSKPLLYALLSLLPGDVMLPCPAWVSYAAQAELAGKDVVPVAIGDEAGGVPDPDALARAAPSGTLVLTLPDNPTGTVASAELVRAIVEIAEATGLTLVSDEIYRDLAYGDAFLSPAEALPERTFVTSGLSKSMALGGYRIGFARMPDSELGRLAGAAVAGLASEVWSSLAAPMQHVAAYVLEEPREVREHVAACRRLHEAVSRDAWGRLVAAGVGCRPPAGGFYLYPDFGPLRPRLGVAGSDALAELLLDRFGIAVLPGTAFGDAPDALRVRMATSLLYGRSDEQRWEALASADPAALPWIASALDRLEAAVRELAGP